MEQAGIPSYNRGMILLRPGTGAPLEEYGIEIPASPDRVARILEVLRAHETIGPREREWLIGEDGSEVTRQDILRTHSPEYVERLFSEKVDEIIVGVYELVDKNGNYHRYNPENATRPLSGLFDRSFSRLAGTYQACKVAVDTGFCFCFGGGGHHAHREFGHGFCILNDIMVALHKMQTEGRAGTIWVIDVDAHKGDGVAAIARDDEAIVTLSVHMAHGWPLDLPEFREDGSRHPSYTPSDIDVPIESGEEGVYNQRLAAALDALARYPKPDLALIEMGADPYEKDELPSTDPLNLTLEQMNERNLLIYEFLKSRSIPSAYLMSGGYGKHAWEPYPHFLVHALLDRLT